MAKSGSSKNAWNEEKFIKHQTQKKKTDRKKRWKKAKNEERKFNSLTEMRKLEGGRNSKSW